MLTTTANPYTTSMFTVTSSAIQKRHSREIEIGIPISKTMKITDGSEWSYLWIDWVDDFEIFDNISIYVANFTISNREIRNLPL